MAKRTTSARRGRAAAAHRRTALWLGLDTGTGGSRAVLVDRHGRVRAAASAAHAPMRLPHPQWAEQEPDDWWRAAKRAVQGVVRQARAAGGTIVGVGLTGQMHGVVLLDAQGGTLGPAIIWCDGRAQEDCDDWTARLGAERIVALTGNPMLAGFSAPKLSWLRRHEPARWRRGRHFLLPKDFIRQRLTGELATDVSDASGTGLLDVARRRWSEEMVAAMELDPRWLPAVHESSAVCARISQAAARETGLSEGTPVVGGAGDQAAGAIGNGLTDEGLASVTVGTSGVVFAATGQMRADPLGRVHAFCHAVPGQWHLMAVTQSAGLSLRWLREAIGPGPGRGDGYERLCREAERAEAGSRGLIFLPYLMGERTPHLDPAARGGWIGLTAAHRRQDLIRSVLEGVAYSLREGLEIMQALGIRPQRLALSGGGARGKVWPRIQCDVFGLPCVRWRRDEGAAYGAALLAMAGTQPGGEGAGMIAATVAEVTRQGLAPAAQWIPDPQRRRAYDDGYAAYRECYPRLRELFPRLTLMSARKASNAG